MKFKEKVFVLIGFINDTIDKMTKVTFKRIQKNKPVPSGLFAFEFDGQDEIRTFGDLKKLHNVFVHRCKMDAKFEQFLSSVVAEHINQSLEERCLNHFDQIEKSADSMTVKIVNDKPKPTVEEDVKKMQNERGGYKEFLFII